LDAYHPKEIGGVGKTFEWDWVAGAGDLNPYILSGGLNPENVGRAVETLKPYAVDSSSGVEAELCKKDPEKVRAFIRNAKAAASL
jgi:phosphoribosylanthranilate isomerase